MKSLNHIFRTIWSEALETWVAVSELTPSKGKSRSCVLTATKLADNKIESGNIEKQKRRLRFNPICFALACCYSLHAQANPTGAQVVNGTASINQTGNLLTVTNSPNAIINWQGFSIGAGQTTNFVQQSASSSVLNRVIGPDPSSLLGALTSNGKVFLINPAGIVVGQGARIDVPSFVASTLNLSNADFLAGKLNFTSNPNAGNIQNSGTISTPEGGSVYLVAPQVENNGIISTPKGETILAAGNTVQLIDTGTPGVTVQITGSSNTATNLGQILADSGQIGVVGAVVKNSGTINANSIVTQGGKIFLKATQSVEAGGTISAQGVGGGSISVLADMQNGTVKVTGTLDASAPLAPPLVKGGLGGISTPSNGGQIETSAAHVQIADTAHATTASAMGLAGTWLIDPVDFTIATSGGDITGAALTTNLSGGNITILSSSGTHGGTSGNINVNDTVSWSANTLTLNAYNNININTAMNGSGTAKLALLYGQGATNGVISSVTAVYNVNAPVNLEAGQNFSTKLGSSGTPVNYTVITSLGSAGSTTTTDLQGINGGLSGNYVLGGNIDATATSGWNSGAGFVPIGNWTNRFTGTFDGLRHTISNLTINLPTTSYVGLFGYMGTHSVVQNVGLVGGSVTGSYEVGGLVGNNDGYGATANINNSHATGNVTGSSSSIGGLVGNNYGTDSGSGSINNSYATGNVTGGSNVGGLVGENFAWYNGINYITNTYSTGRVSGSSYTGGLVGNGGGSATNSFWNITTSGKTTSVLGTGLTTTQMQTASNFMGFNFTTTPGATGNNWVMVDANGTLNNTSGAAGATFPMLASEYSTTINNAHQLQLMEMALGASYTLGNNIVATATGNSTDVWGSSGFIPIGNLTTNFTGTFDGLSNTISNLTINLPAVTGVGLFGWAGTGAVIRNVGLVGGSVSGYNEVGALVANNAGTISNSYSTGSVSGNSYTHRGQVLRI